MDLLRQTFDGCLINRNGDVNWLSRSCDLRPLDYYIIWGAVKEKFYANKSETIKHFKANIRDAIAQMRPHIHEKAHETNFIGGDDIFFFY